MNSRRQWHVAEMQKLKIITIQITAGNLHMADITIVETAMDQSGWPDWAKEAWDNGSFFATAIEIVRLQEIELGHAEATIITLRRELNP